MPEGEGAGGAGIDTSSKEFEEAAEAWLEQQGIKSALDSERDARKKAEQKLRQLDGVDPEEYKRLKADAEKAEEERQRAEGNFEQLLEKERGKMQELIAERDEKIEALTASLESTLIESAAKSAISAHGGDAELLLPHVTRSAKLVERDGRHVAVVVDDKGEPRLAPDAKTAQDYMGIEHLVNGWKADGKYPGAFAGTGASGGGAPPGSGGGGGGGGAPRSVSASDAKAILANEEAIAKGEVVVAFD